MREKIQVTEARPGRGIGASEEAIKAHYDVGNEFFSLWLDETMTYSCAMWERPDDDLETAQIRKLDFHIASSMASGKERILDVGCGWGSMLARLTGWAGVGRAVGLTTSKEQARYVKDRNLPGVDIRFESWRDHVCATPYDAIVSIGALEHFVRPGDSSADRIETYRDFFTTCRRWLAADGRLSLQTIAYDSGDYMDGSVSEVFPESDLPRLSELRLAFEGSFHLESLRSDGKDYSRTLDAWSKRLRSTRVRAVALVGEDSAARYERFLRAAQRGFDRGVFTLLRLQLVPRR